VALVSIALVPTGSPGGVLALLCGATLGLVIVAVIAVIVYVGTALFAPLIMMENAGAVDSLTRSWRVTKGHRWSLFGSIIVTAILNAIVVGVIGFPAGFFGIPVVSLFVSALAAGVSGSWFPILFAVAYDLIVRQPGTIAPPYYPGSTMAPPAGAAQGPPQPPASPGPPPSP
jgi:uncharacterized membrane protein